MVPSLSKSNLFLLPLNNDISVFRHRAIITAFTARPNHVNLPLLTQFLMLARPKHSLSSEEGFLSFKVTLDIHHIILMSLRSTDLNKSISFTFKVSSLPYSLTLLTHSWYTLPSERREKSLQVMACRRSLNVFYPDLVLVITLSSAPPPALIMSPRLQDLTTTKVAPSTITCSTYGPL